MQFRSTFHYFEAKSRVDKDSLVANDAYHQVQRA